MGDITPETVKDIADTVVRVYAAVRGSKGSGLGVGDSSLPLADDWGASAEIRRLHARTAATGDLTVIGHVAVRHSRSHDATGNFRAAARQLVSSLVADLNMACGQSSHRGVNYVNDFATLHNTGREGPWKCLLPPAFLAIYKDLYPRNDLSAMNFYLPGGWLASAGPGKSLVTDAASDGGAERGAGYERPRAVFSEDAKLKEGNGTVHGVGRMPGGGLRDGLAWTFRSGHNPAGYSLKPADGDAADALLLRVTDVDMPPGMTDGTVTISGGDDTRP